VTEKVLNLSRNFYSDTSRPFEKPNSGRIFTAQLTVRRG
jgi:hypothetical protein